MASEDYICTYKTFNQLTLNELYAILRLRAEVFVVEQDCPYQDLDNKDQESGHLMYWTLDQRELMAYTRIVPKGVAYQNYTSIGRVVTSQKARGTGLGRRLMKTSIKRCLQNFPDLAIKISAQCYLLQFYKNLGFDPIGEPYLEDNIPHQAMIWKESKSNLGQI